MQNTYDKIIKYLIENGFDLSIKPKGIFFKVQIGYNGRYSQSYIDQPMTENGFEYAVTKNLSMIFPSFKDFNTPIKGL